ncbi:hypothetical protein KAU11_06020, partial [Candidatus Babeliales bacterium]|nr:hypothetical protein [Candidatus Babeliales bacterium]
INALLQSWQEMVSKSSLKLALRIVPLCAVNPFLTARNVEKHCGVAFTTAQRALKKLESLGIIKQVEGKVRNRVYCAIEILKILEEPFSL